MRNFSVDLVSEFLKFLLLQNRSCKIQKFHLSVIYEYRLLKICLFRATDWHKYIF